MSTIPSPLFYVYVLARPKNRVFYVGKGSDYRIVAHESEARSGHKCHKCNVIRKIWKQGGQVQRYTVFTTDDEAEAYAYEAELIAMYGLNTLANQSIGGIGGATGRVRSARERQRQSASTKAQWANPELRAKIQEGLKRGHNTPESRAKHDANLKAQWSNPDARARKSAQSKAMWADPEFKARMRVKNKAAQSTPEARARMTARNNARWADPEYRAVQGARLAAQAGRASKAAHARKRIPPDTHQDVD